MKRFRFIPGAVLILLLMNIGAEAQTSGNAGASLEEIHKSALECGDYAGAMKIEEKMKIMSFQNYDQSQVPEVTGMEELPAGDWYSTDKSIYGGPVKSSIDSGKTLDVKLGEDGVLYSAHCGLQNSATFPNVITIKKSTDNGANWSYVIGYQYINHLGSLSMLVESRDNNNPDSTRIIIFFTLSSNPDLSNATVNYFSVRSNGSANMQGQLAIPPSGKKFCHVSAFSDGAFYANATYFGVVFTECDNYPSFTGVTKTRYFRTINWGSSWTNSILTTGAADYFPSADYKEGNSDSVYIAVERRISSEYVNLQLIKTPFAPVSSFAQLTIHQGVSWSTKAYRKPSLAIQKTNPSSYMAVSYCGSGVPYYSDSYNGSAVWSLHSVEAGNMQSCVFTNLAAAEGGYYPFAMTFISVDGDSVHLRKFAANTTAINTYKINSANAGTRTLPIAVVRPAGSRNLTNICYAGTNVAGDSLLNAYSDFEGNKVLNLKMCLQGFYNPASNRNNMRDTISISIRKWLEFDIVIDSAKAILDSVSGIASFSFQNLPDNYYSIVIRHRNSVESWTSAWIKEHSASHDITIAANKVFGNNQIQVDTSPVIFAIYGGDADQDGAVDATDLSMIDNDSYVFASGYKKTDINGDRFVDASDASIADNNASNFVQSVRP